MGEAATIPLQEYCEIEESSDVRFEYFEGEIFAMAGSSPEHSLISGNLISALKGVLKGRCLVYTCDLRVQVEPTGLYTHPDAVVCCGPGRFSEKPTSLTNPVLVAEVLSPSTEGYDRTIKFDHYRQIDSLQVYLLVAQDQPRVEIFSRGAGSEWNYNVVSGMAASLFMPHLEVDLRLAEIFADVLFPSAPVSVMEKRATAVVNPRKALE